MKIWVRYLSSQLLQTFCFFLFAFFLLYILIDFSTHMQDFFVEKTLSFTKLSTYYLLQLLKRLLFLLPLALLVATIRVLTSLQVHRELIALQASGIHLKKILQPFFLLAIFCSFLGYANEEFLTPQALSFLELTQKTGKKDSLHKGPKRQFTILNLNDSSKLIYQKIDKEKNAFFDVYWVRSFNDIWKMKYLSTCPESPLGTYVDHITRNEQGFLEKQESFSQLLLPALHWETQLLHKKQSSTRYQKPSELISLLCSPNKQSFHIQGEIKTHLAYKLLMPLMPFLVLLGVIPYCVRYSRTLPLFLIYSLALFGFIVFSTGINALTILGENQVFSPYAALLIPFVLALGSTYWNFHKKLF